jgi:hypothetical protein
MRIQLCFRKSDMKSRIHVFDGSAVAMIVVCGVCERSRRVFHKNSSLAQAGYMLGIAALLAVTSAAVADDNDRILWRFEAQGSLVWHRPTVAPSGAILFMDSGGILYALDPSGAPLWSANTGGAGLEGPVAIGADGTIFVASNPLGRMLNIRAYTQEGEPQWTFPDQSQELIAGPAVGPDGNIYGVNDVPGLGAFSLTPGGALRWNNPGFSDFGTQGTEIVFGPASGHTHLYFCANGLLTATRLDGTLEGFCTNDLHQLRAPFRFEKSAQKSQIILLAADRHKA